jgi:hypothetical protein
LRRKRGIDCPVRSTLRGLRPANTQKIKNGNLTKIYTYLEDSFLDSKPLRRAAAFEDVDPGTWFFDYDDGFVIIADNPLDREVELIVMRNAFHGAAGD